MQKFIAKYGFAAHLSAVTVAPLLLFPFLSEWALTVVQFWLVGFASVWLFFEPSVLAGEGPTDARRRVVRAILRDPLFWCMVVVVLLAGARALNSGIALSYDAETSSWRVASAAFPLLPGAVESVGVLPFALILSFLVILQGCRHSLGRAARAAYLVMTVSLAGLSAVSAHVALFFGCEIPSIGFVFGVYWLTALAVLAVALENGWQMSILPMIVAIGGTGAGLFSFATALEIVSFAAAFLLLLIYVIVYAKMELLPSAKLCLFVVLVLSAVLGVLLVFAALSEAQLAERIAPLVDFAIFPEQYWQMRAALSTTALKSWLSHLWVGTGLGSFLIDFRFQATPQDWQLMPQGMADPLNAWWLVLVERGVVGIVLFVMPFVLLLTTYVRRVIGFFGLWVWPQPLCPLACLLMPLFVGLGFFGSSSVRVESVVAVGAALAVSAATFPKRKESVRV